MRLSDTIKNGEDMSVSNPFDFKNKQFIPNINNEDERDTEIYQEGFD